jgi:hypothetical protein
MNTDQGSAADVAPPSGHPGAEQVAPLLWCCHVRGPDEVHAAPDYETALAWSDMLNAMNWRSANPAVRLKDPVSFEDCLIKAVPALWPHSRESHAEDLPKSIAGFAIPNARAL